MSESKAFQGYPHSGYPNDDLPEVDPESMLDDERREHNAFVELMSDKWPDIKEGPLWRLMRKVFIEAREDLRNE